MHSKTSMFLTAVLCSAAILITPSFSSAWWAGKTDSADQQETIDQTASVQEASEASSGTDIDDQEPVAVEVLEESEEQDVMAPEAIEPEISEIMEEEPEPALKESVIDETGIYYTIKKGDTLWDLSNKFFDSPWVWPDLWSQNKQILNPHLIYPGDRIHIYQHEGSYMIEKVPPEEASGQSEEVQNGTSEQGSIQITEEPVQEIKDVPKKPVKLYEFSKIDRVGFIREEAVTPHGTIISMEGSKLLISKGDIVYIKQNEAAPSLIAGSLYTIYRTQKDPIRDKKAKITYGIQHDLQGVVEITEIQPDYAVARVIKNFDAIHIKDMLMPYKRLSTEIPMTEGVEGLDGKVITSENHGSIYGELTIVFIDKGEKDGVFAGQTYSIYYQEKIGSVTRDIDFGFLLVLRTEYSTSTAIITQSHDTVRPGAKIHSTPK